jgi:hypothetical protein
MARYRSAKSRGEGQVGLTSVVAVRDNGGVRKRPVESIVFDPIPVLPIRATQKLADQPPMFLFSLDQTALKVWYSLARNIHPLKDVPYDLSIVIVHARGRAALLAVPVPPAQGAGSMMLTVVTVGSRLGTGVRGRGNGISRGIDRRLEGQGLIRVDEVDGEQRRSDPESANRRHARKSISAWSARCRVTAGAHRYINVGASAPSRVYDLGPV